MRMYKNAIAHMNEIGIPQWDEIYPSEEFIREDIDLDEMVIGLSDDRVVCAFTVNQDCDEQYENGDWRYPDLSFSVIHRLCVDPNYQGRGVGSQILHYIEDTLRSETIESIRLDAFSQNPIALRLYAKHGYNKVGEVTFRKGVFYLFEKKL